MATTFAPSQSSICEPIIARVASPSIRAESAVERSSSFWMAACILSRSKCWSARAWVNSWAMTVLFSSLSNPPFLPPKSDSRNVGFLASTGGSLIRCIVLVLGS